MTQNGVGQDLQVDETEAPRIPLREISQTAVAEQNFIVEEIVVNPGRSTQRQTENGNGEQNGNPPAAIAAMRHRRRSTQ